MHFLFQITFRFVFCKIKRSCANDTEMQQSGCQGVRVSGCQEVEMRANILSFKNSELYNTHNLDDN